MFALQRITVFAWWRKPSCSQAANWTFTTFHGITLHVSGFPKALSARDAIARRVKDCCSKEHLPAGIFHCSWIPPYLNILRAHLLNPVVLGAQGERSLDVSKPSGCFLVLILLSSSFSLALPQPLHPSDAVHLIGLGLQTGYHLAPNGLETAREPTT